MKRKAIFLNLALLVMAGSLVWLLRARWLDSQTRQRAVLSRRIPAKNVFAPPSSPPVKSVAPAEYIDVAQKMLFSKDRNPVVVIDTPAPKPEPPMPALPQYFGQMAIGDPIVLLSVAGGSQSGIQKGYHAGDEIGDFKLISFDRDMIALEWHGKKVERRVEDLKPKDSAPPAAVAAAPQPAAAAPAAPPPVPVTALGFATAANPAQKVDPALGDDLGNGQRSCVAGDTSPAGTILSGYKKAIYAFMFGPICRWEQNK